MIFHCCTVIFISPYLASSQIYKNQPIFRDDAIHEFLDWQYEWSLLLHFNNLIRNVINYLNWMIEQMFWNLNVALKFYDIHEREWHMFIQGMRILPSNFENSNCICDFDFRGQFSVTSTFRILDMVSLMKYFVIWTNEHNIKNRIKAVCY